RHPWSQGPAGSNSTYQHETETVEHGTEEYLPDIFMQMDHAMEEICYLAAVRAAMGRNTNPN
ncbi:MAG: hypothetical protein AAF570_22865, partial [Bacteroidota bacterium]